MPPAPQETPTPPAPPTTEQAPPPEQAPQVAPPKAQVPPPLTIRAPAGSTLTGNLSALEYLGDDWMPNSTIAEAQSQYEAEYEEEVKSRLAGVLPMQDVFIAMLILVIFLFVGLIQLFFAFLPLTTESIEL